MWRSQVAYPDKSGGPQMANEYKTYIIESTTRNRWYYGHTQDTEARLRQHNSGSTKSTKNRGPWVLIFERAFDSRTEANKFELELKRHKNKEYIKREYAEYFL